MTAIDYCAAEFNVDFVHILYTKDKSDINNASAWITVELSVFSLKMYKCPCM